MGRVWAIAINTFREAVRDKVLFGMLGFASFALLVTLALAELSLHQQRRVVLDIGLASISLFGVAMAIFLGSSLLYKEIERKTLYVILPKAIRRWEFLLGKYTGIVLTGAVFIAIMGAVQLWVASIQADPKEDGAMFLLRALRVPGIGGACLAAAIVWARRRGADPSGMVFGWSFAFLALSAALAEAMGVTTPPILAALALSLTEVMVLASVAMFFGSFSTPFLTGAFTFGVWLVGRSADEMADMRSEAVADSVKVALHALARVVPNFDLFVPGSSLLEGTSEAAVSMPAYVFNAVAYGVLYAALALALAAVIFRRRDLL
ncbi:MAG: ABC transporter permease [Sandaracinaceae bacterium]